MLTMMRALLRTKAAGLLFILLIVAMAAWGVTDVFGGGLGKNLVGAGNRTVSDQQFDATVERILSGQTDDRGRSITKDQALENGLIDQIFQQEQFDLALRAYGDTVGVTATKNAIKEELIASTIFHDTTGAFDPVQYTAILEQNRLSPAMYEDNLEKTLTKDRLNGVPTAALIAPTALARIEAAYAGEARGAEWFRLSKSQLPAIEAPTEEELQAMFSERGAALREPERRAISMIRISPDDFLARADVTDDDVSAFYDAYKAERYTGPDTRRFTEFNFADEETARAALGRIAGGARSDALEGLDSIQERTGGRDAITNPRLSDQVFQRSAQTGGIYGPQLNGTLWTVIRLEEIIPGDEVPFEDVEAQIFDELARAQAISIYYDALPRFDDLIGTGADLEAIGEDIGVPVLSFDAVDQRGVTANGRRLATLLEAPELLQKAFNRPEGSKTERLGDDEITWMARVDGIVPERAPEFEEVRDLLVEALIRQKEGQQLQTVAAEIELAISSGEKTLASAAADYGSTIEALPRPLTRANFRANLPNTLVGHLFEARNEGELHSDPASTDEYVVLQVTAIERPGAEVLDVLARASASNIQTDISNDLYQAFVVEIQKETELKVNAAALAAYKSSIVAQQ